MLISGSGRDRLSDMKHPFPEIWWTHRRRHAYLSILGLFVILLIAVFAPPEQIEAAQPLLTAVTWAFTAVLLLYGGTSVAEDIAKIRSMTQ